jgi:hypothetical protein
VESLLSNSLVDGEVTDEFREFADGEIKKQAKNRRERENKASAMQNYFAARPPSHEELRNANAYIEESAMTETLFRCTQSLQWSLVAPGQADILVTNNVASIPPELHWPALLNGMWVVNPAAIVGGCGPSTIKFKASTEIKRSLWLSHVFCASMNGSQSRSMQPCNGSPINGSCWQTSKNSPIRNRRQSMRNRVPVLLHLFLPLNGRNMPGSSMS